jgi:hypothetical protein
VGAVQSHAHVSVDDGHVLHPAVGSGPEVDGVKPCLSPKALVGRLGEFDGQLLHAHLLPCQRHCGTTGQQAGGSWA